MFFRHAINPYPITDKAVFRNADKTLTLTVRKDPTSLIQGLKAVSEKMKTIDDSTSEMDQILTARMFATAIFGEDQAIKLLQFYGQDALAVMSVCNLYFRDRLSKKITKAQKAK